VIRQVRGAKTRSAGRARRLLEPIIVSFATRRFHHIGRVRACDIGVQVYSILLSSLRILLLPFHTYTESSRQGAISCDVQNAHCERTLFPKTMNNGMLYSRNPSPGHHSPVLVREHSIRTVPTQQLNPALLITCFVFGLFESSFRVLLTVIPLFSERP
jgi:hypothetical protein